MQVDAEWHALRSGIKPALRLSGDTASIASVADRYRSMGFAVLVGHGTVGGAPGDVLYVGRSPDFAEAARAAEAPLLEATTRPSAVVEIASMRRLGAALGYPACCVEAFCARYTLSPHGRFRRDYRAVRAAWVPSPRWALNHLLRASDWTAVSFEPCLYDCPAALEHAERVLAAIAGADATGRVRLEQNLRVALVVSITGARAVVELGSDGRIARAEPPRSPDGGTRGLDARFALELTGRAAGTNGTLRVGRRRALLVDFRQH